MIGGLMNLEDVVKKIEAGEIKAPFCFLCKKPPEYTNAYVPTPDVAKRLGQPKGKQRVIIYGVCEPCMDQHGKSEIMELMERSVLQRHGLQ
jgi:hypothetical protein